MARVTKARTAVLDRKSAASKGWVFIAKTNGTQPCRERPDLYDPEYQKDSRQRQAKALCAGCPFLVECREEGLKNPQSWGIWGGLTAGERRAIREMRNT